jgi:hypothetical protein
MTPLPTTVMRFYGNTSFGFDVLEQQKIALVRSTLLNDPFDPYGFFETDFTTYADLIRHVRANHRRDLGWFQVQVTPISWVKTERELQEYMVRLRTDTFVLCGSAPTATTHPKENLYMWGHYGNGHRGLAIEYDRAALTEVVLNHHRSEGNAPLTGGEQVWAQMEYARSFRAITAEDVFLFLNESHEVELGRKREPDETALDRYYRQLSVIKSEVWKPENEWRLMWRSTTETGNIYEIPIAPKCIRAVYLGLAMSDADKEKAVDMVVRHFPDAEVWFASKRHGDLLLDFHRVPER